MSTGFVLNIPQEMINRLEDADKKIEKLARTSEDAQTRIVSAFKSIGTHGLDAFITKINEVQSKLSQLGNTQINVGANTSAFTGLTSQAQNVIDEVNRIVAAMGKVKKAAGDTGMAKNPFAGMTESLKDWNNLQSKIDEADQKIKKLTSTTMDYERQMERIRNGQQIPVAISYNEYVYAKDKIAALQEEKKVYQEKQAEITKQNNALSEQVRIQESLKRFVMNQNSLPEQRKRQEYEAMRQMYIEVEKAEKERQKLREKRIREEEKAAERERKAYERMYKQLPATINTKQAGQLVARSMDATSINQRLVAIKNLQAAINNLDSTDKRYDQTVRKLNSEINRQKEELKKLGVEIDKVRTSHRSLMDISGQLARKLALVFSVSQITGYVKKLIEVRGEFELQQRSLQAILQNKDEANRIWQQTVDLAVRSPFRVKELVSYTKQLAAYRIESDKLFETNKMLADISAGLGVDMQRLILAFGQVRSAAYLRGTELRQFTEAGIPILEQLAQYFTELEGRAVSVGDVFERVSKRMVSFADVEEIFKRMTSEGGTFYRMQEIQAETLQGQISNLKDSVDIMLNDIGKANEATLKNSVTMVRNFVENWEEVAAVIGHVLKILSPLLATMALVKLGSSSLGKTVVSVATGLWNFAGSVEKVGLGMTGLSIKTAVATKAVQTLKTALIGLGSGVATVALSAFVYWCLEVWRKSTEAERSIKKLNGALEEIYTQDTSTLKTQIRGFENLVGRLKEANENTRERREIISQINSQYGEYLGFIVDEKTSYEQLANSIDSVTLALTRRAKATSFEKALAEVYGKTNETIAESEKVLRDTMDDIFGTQVDGKALSLLPNEEEIIKIFDLIDKKTIELGRPLESSEIREVLEGFYGYFVSFNTTQKEAADFMSAIERRGQAVLTQREKELEIDRRINEVYKDNAESAAEATKAFKELEERRTAALSDAKGAPKWQVEKIKRDFEIEKIDLQVKYEGLDKATADLRKKTLESMNATVNDINKKIEGSISKLGEKYANLIYIDETEAATGVNQIAENTAAAYKAQKEILKQQNSLKEAGTAYDADILKNAQKSADAYYYKLQLLGRLDLLQKETAKEETKEMKLLRQQLAALKEAGQTYQNLRKDFDMTTATQKTASAFKDLFAELKMTDLTKEMSFDELGILKVLEELPNKAGDAGKKAIEKLRAEFLSERDVEAQRKRSKLLLDSIQEEFDRYDLSLELKKLNIPPDLAKSLFDVDYLDLEGLKKAVQEQEAKFIGTDMEKDYKDLLDKIADMEDKAAKERMKTYSKYLLEGMSERVKLKIEEMRKLKEIEESDEFTPEQKERIKEGVSKEARAEQQKQEWKDFQGTEMYTMMFEDLEHYGSAAIDMLYTKLYELKTSLSDLPASEVKEIVGQIEKLENIKIERNPFESLKTYKNEVKNIGFSEEELQNMLMGEVNIEKQAQDIIDVINIVQQSIADGGEEAKILQELTPEQLRSWEQAKNIQQQTGETLDGVAKRQERIVKKSKEHQTTIVGQQKAYKKLDKSQEAALKETEVWLNSVGDLFSASKELMESLGVESDSVAMTIADTGSSMVSLILSAVQFTAQLYAMGIAANSALGIIGWVAIAIQAVAMAIAAIFSAKDKALQKQVEDNLSTVEELQKRYDALEESIDNAWDTSSIRAYNRDLKATTQSMINAQKAAIAAQEKRKKANKEGSDAYKELQDMKAELDEMENQLAESLEESFSKVTDGILDSVHDAAKEFTDAWWDAFIETGDGLSGLEENFNEMFLNLAKNQAAMQITGAFADRWKRDLEKYINADDTELTKDEAKKWAEEVRRTMPELSAALEGYLGAFKDMATAEGAGLSGLQKGIQGITEDQADVLAAYWNSVRGYTASIDSKMDLVLANLGVGAEDNPMLEQMRLVAKNTSAINTLLNSLVKSGHTQGGLGLKVFMD